MFEILLLLILCAVIIVVLLYFTSCPIFVSDSMEKGPIGFIRYMNMSVPDNKTIIDNFASSVNTTVKDYNASENSIIKFGIYFPLLKQYKFYELAGKLNEDSDEYKQGKQEYEDYITANTKGLDLGESLKFTYLSIIKSCLTRSYK